MKVYIVSVEDEFGATKEMFLYKDIKKAISKEYELMEKDKNMFVYNSIHEVLE